MDPAAAELIEVGRVAEPWGVKGWIKVHAHASDPQALLRARRWVLRRDTRMSPLQTDAGPGRDASLPPDAPGAVEVLHVRGHGGGLVAQLAGVVDRDGAQALKGAGIWVARAAFPPPGDDEYYWVDLIGLEVVNREGLRLGKVLELTENAAHSVLHVGLTGAQASVAQPGATKVSAHLIPFVSAYVDTVDLAARRITVDWQADYSS